MENEEMSLESTPQLAARWGVTRARIHQMIHEGLIPQATRVGRDWVVSGRPERPASMRTKKEQ